ncbi:MAG: YraN family protein [Rickettsiales bacterium]|nr:YraN family protein [Rickettsiales bacterium]
MNHHQFGLLAEKIVVISLRFRFYTILATRYKTRRGEVDIIAKKSNKIFFIEVKARKDKGNIERVLSKKQIGRIKNAANIFIAKNNHLKKYKCYFDFIEVNRFFIYKHHRNFIC